LTSLLSFPRDNKLPHAIPYFFFPLFSLWDKALPAADLEALLVRPSFSTLDAAEAALAEVVFWGALVWLRALPDAVLELLPVDLLVRVFAALKAAFFPVTFFVMSGLLVSVV
jgi:hypothetical protein